MTQPLSHESDMEALQRAVPYLRMFRDKTFVIKVGGEVGEVEEQRRTLAEQVRVLWEVGIRVVLVHGGGPQTTALCERLGVPVRMVGGRRITDERALEAAILALNGAVNTAWVASLRGLGVQAVGLSGMDGGMIQGVRREPVRVDGADGPVDFGFVGEIRSVRVGLLATLLEAGFLPVVSPLSADDSGQVLNINADTAAAHIATALAAEKLIFVTAVPGLLEDPRDPASIVSCTDLKRLQDLRQRAAISGGMLPKARAAESALGGGVRRVHIIGWREPLSLLVEVFTNDGSGTMIVSDLADLNPTG